VQAGAQTLDVPHPGTRDGLVEVVDVEDEVPLRAAKNPKLLTWASPQAWTGMAVVGVESRSMAITAAAPRKKAKGDSAMR
jgi:hypothetical protein